MSVDLRVRNSALLVDLYELTMAAGYFERHMDCRATFELFVRHLPRQRAFLVAAGIESALDYLENLHFTEEDIRFLRGHSAFRAVSDAFFDYLRGFRFTGEVAAVDEGAVIFEEEPILQVSAPIGEAQVVETYLLSLVNFETLVATKAARVVRAAGGRSVLEFGTRRAQGPEAGLRAARAAYLGGCVATSNVLAGQLDGIPIAGTAAHSWTQAFPTERESFEALLETFPDSAILLIDTYDPLAGAETAASLGRKIAGVRLDSGDLLEKSRQVRQILDRHGLTETQIVASGDLNEFRIAELVRKGAPIDVWGVGTDLATSRDVPALGVVYKLVEIERGGQAEAKTKFSEQKAYWPGRKQVFRFSENAVAGRRQKYHHDLVARFDESYPEAEPLLRAVMRHGLRLEKPWPVEKLRARALANIGCLPEDYFALEGAPHYPVLKSAVLDRMLEEARERYVGASAASESARQ